MGKKRRIRIRKTGSKREKVLLFWPIFTKKDFLPFKVAEMEASEMSCELREVIFVHFSAHVQKPGKGIPVLA